MPNGLGVWIDHRKAVIVTVSPAGSTAVVVMSLVEKHPERTGDSPLEGSYEARQVPADDSLQRAFTAGLNAYYDSVIHSMDGVNPLIVFGPGEAKVEFHKRLQATKSSMQVLSVAPADKMTDNQIVAKVRAYFGFEAPRRANSV